MSIKCEKGKKFKCLPTYQLINLSYLEHMANGNKEIYAIKKNTIHLMKQLNIKDYRSKHGT
jgi:hypothetical protein